MVRHAEWTSTADILATVLPNLSVADRLQEYRVWEGWEEVVGLVIARKARPSKIHRGKLFVTVSNSAYIQEMYFYKARIREAVNQKLGTPVVKDIFFVLGSVRDLGMQPTPARRRLLS